MIRTDLYYQKINDLKTALKDASYSLDIDNQREELSRLEKELEKLEVKNNSVNLKVKPFEIITLRVKR